MRRGVAYLLKHRSSDGSWYGRWGVNYIYGSFLAMRGLAGERRAGHAAKRWSGPRTGCGRFRIPTAAGANRAPVTTRDRFVPAPSSASQTAWALLGLRAAGDRDSAQFRRGVEYLLQLQTPEGKWPEEATTGTGFPNVFYLTYAMYRDYFPLLALSQT